MKDFYNKFVLTDNKWLAVNQLFMSLCLMCRAFRLGFRSCFYSESRTETSFEFVCAFGLVLERMESEMSRFKENSKKRWQNENGKEKSTARAVRPRIGGSCCVYGLGDGDAKGSLGNGSEGGAK